jgi:hypothetical protein
MKLCQVTSNHRIHISVWAILYNVNSTLYSIGRSRYSQNLDLLVPFFESPSLELESIEKVKFCQPLELLFVLHFVTPLLFSDVHSWKCVSYFFLFWFSTRIDEGREKLYLMVTTRNRIRKETRKKTIQDMYKWFTLLDLELQCPGPHLLAEVPWSIGPKFE